MTAPTTSEIGAASAGASDGFGGLAPQVMFELLNSCKDGVVVTDPLGRIVFFNHGAEEIFGYDEVQVRGRNISVLLPDGARRRHPELIARFAAGEDATWSMDSRRRLRGRRHDGTQFPASITVMKTTTSCGRTYMAAIVRDVSDVIAEQD